MKINKKQKNGLIYGGIILLILLGVYFSLTSLSTVEDTREKQMWDDMRCSVPQDCYDELISMGFPKTDLDLQLKDSELICEFKICGVVLK